MSDQIRYRNLCLLAADAWDRQGKALQLLDEARALILKGINAENNIAPQERGLVA